MGEKKRSVLRVAGRVAAAAGAVAVVGGLAAATVSMALFGDTVRSLLGISSVVDVTEEEADATMETGLELAREVEAEGLVLVQNEDDCLPLPASTTKVNVFGWGSTAWVASGSGSGQVAGETQDLLGALKDAGIEYNTELASMYRSYADGREFEDTGALNCHDYEFCRLYEPNVADEDWYTPELLASAEDFSDTAIVVISRTAGESIDCPRVQFKVDADGGVAIDPTRSYLDLSSEEEALLAYVGGAFDHVVVVVNSTNTMELGKLETTPGVDAALFVGATGETGAAAVVDALWGRVNPSGRTTDTYAYDFATAASWANSGARGEGRYVGSDGLYPADGAANVNVGAAETYDAVRYVDYVEGIYVGYRWYETADAEGFWDDVANEYGEGYDGVVQYPFGYGLSYTDFSWEVVSRSAVDGERVDGSSEFSVTVRVTNTGDVAGKDVVELYCDPPYYQGGVEKSSTVLVDYAKTELLEPGESCEVTLSFALVDVASYDCYDANNSGFTGYELDWGEYTVELRRDVHTAAECDRAVTTLFLPFNVPLPTDSATGATVDNRFTGDAAEDGVSIDGSDSGAGITYLTRADFEGTFPYRRSGDRAMAEAVAALNLYDAAEDTGEEESTQASLSGSSAKFVLCNSRGELTALGKELGLDYEDSRWESVLDALTADELQDFVLHGYLATEKIDAIGKPLTKEVDGPSQVGSFNQLSYGAGYPNATVLAQTWNAELAREVGRQIGLECATIGVDGWYAPCVNVHRTPLGGRNYEYYSEDPLVCGTVGAAVALGARDSGTYTYIKHFAVNNQDSYRDSLYTWLTEQTLREIYLVPFRTCVRSGATGFMSSYNRIGATWAGGNEALLTGVLREEWGFRGTVITDYADHHAYMNVDQSLAAGGDLFMDGWLRDGEFSGEPSTSDLRRAAKDILYTWLNSRASAVVQRPAKTEGFDWLGRGLAIADAAVLIVAVGWVWRRVEKQRAAGRLRA